MNKLNGCAFIFLCYLLSGCCEFDSSWDDETPPQITVAPTPISWLGVPKEETAEEKAESRRKSIIKTWEGYVFLFSWTEAEECGYDTSLLSELEKKELISEGLEILIGNSELKEYSKLNSYILSSYYCEKNDLKKSMYWAFKGAENGSSGSMRILSDAYRSGEGVVQDLSEGLKWVYLGAAAGDDTCKKWVNKHSINLMIGEGTGAIIMEAQKRANEWTEQHPEVFFSCE